MHWTLDQAVWMRALAGALSGVLQLDAHGACIKTRNSETKQNFWNNWDERDETKSPKEAKTSKTHYSYWELTVNFANLCVIEANWSAT